MTHRIRSISVTIAMQNVLKKNKKPRSPDQNRPHLGYHSTFNQIWHKYLQASFAYIVSLPILFTSLSFPLGLSPPLFVLLCIVYAKDMSRVVVVATRIIIIVWWGVEIYTPLISNNSFARLIAMTAPHTERQRERGVTVSWPMLKPLHIPHILLPKTSIRWRRPTSEWKPSTLPPHLILRCLCRLPLSPTSFKHKCQEFVWRWWPSCRGISFPLAVISFC